MNSTSPTTLASGVRDRPDGVPEGWKLADLADLCEINPPKAPLDSLEPDEPVTFVPMPAVDAGTGSISAPTRRPFSEVRQGFTSFQDEDVIMAKITPCMENGKIAIARELLNGLGFGSTEFHVLRSKGAALPEYIYHFIRQESFRRAAEAEMTGSVGQKRVPKSFLERAVVPLPPKKEQVRIVESIDQLLIRVDAARGRLALVLGILKRFRQAVLAAGFRGRLTENWIDSRDFVDSYLQQILAERQAKWERGHFRAPVPLEDVGLLELPEGWTWQSFDSFVTDSFYGPRFAGNEYSDTGVPTIRTTDIGFDGRINLESSPRIDLKASELTKFGLIDGDLLVTRTGATIGKCALYDEPIGPAIPSAYLIRFRLTRDSVPPEYLLYYLMSPQGQGLLLGRSTAVAQPNVNARNICEFPVPLPPRREIEEIVRRIKTLLNLAYVTETYVAAATERAEKLTQAILAKAFRGELVPTEAELARREGRSYEPASALLARIRVERESGGSGAIHYPRKR